MELQRLRVQPVFFAPEPICLNATNTIFPAISLKYDFPTCYARVK